MNTIHNPYIGPRTFKEDERDRFYGREREANELLARVLSEQEIVFYAQSGAGKSSLVNTCLIPDLKKRDFDVLRGRVGGDAPVGLEVDNIFVFNLLRSLSMSDVDVNTLVKQSLNEFLVPAAAVPPASDEIGSRRRALIIDQFEEVFSTHLEAWEKRKEFFEQLAQALEDDPRLRVILVMREDYLASLGPYAGILPSQFRMRYFMQRLEHAAALKAVTEPVKGRDFSRPYEAGAAEKLVDDLRTIKITQPDGTSDKGMGQFVEPLYLQVICYELWNNLQDGPMITTKDVEDVGDVSASLGNYYERRVATVAQNENVNEGKIRKWFTNELISPTGIRNMVLQEPGETSANLENRVIRALSDLVRAEQRGGATFYELTHDRLVEPIIASNKEWFEKNLSMFQRQAALWDQQGRSDGLLLRGAELAKLEDEIKGNDPSDEIEIEFVAACRKLKTQEERERRLNRWLRILTVGAVIAMCAAAVFGFQSLVAKGEAISSAETAQVSEQMAQDQLQKSESLRLALQANSLLNGANANPEQAALLSVRALQTLYVPQADGALVEAMSQLYAVRNFSGQADQIRAVAFSPDGKYVLTGSNDQTAKLWDAATGEEARIFRGHSDWVNSVAFSPDGKYVLTGSDDQTAKLWDAATGEEVHTFSGHSDYVNSVAFSPDGKYILTGSGDLTAKLWNATTGEEIRTFSGHSDFVRSVAFSPDGKYVLTGSNDQTAKLWDAATGEEVRTFSGHSAWIQSVAFSPDGKYVLTGGGDTTAMLWDVTTGEEVRTFSGHPNSVFAVAFSPDGKFILTGSADKTSKLWDVTTGEEVRTFRGHSSWVNGVAFSPDNRYVLTGSADTTAKLWNVSDVLVHRIFAGHSDVINSAAFSPDNKYVLTGSDDSTAKLWDMTTGEEVHTFSGHAAWVQSVAFSPDGKYVLTGSGDSTAKLWNVKTGKEIQTFSADSDAVNSVAFSPDGKYVLTGSGDSTAKLWNVTTGEEIRTFSGHSQPINAVAFSPIGKYVLTGSQDTTAKLWDVTTGEEVRTYSGHSDTVYAVVFSPDGKYVLTGSIDNTAKLWETETGTEIRTFKGHSDRVFAVAFSPDGKFILTGSADKTAKLWDAATGQEVRTLSGHSGFIWSVAFSPDGLYVTTASSDKTARLWDVDYRKTMDLACSLLTRDLRIEERAEYEIVDNTPTCLQSETSAELPTIEPNSESVQVQAPTEKPTTVPTEISAPTATTVAAVAATNTEAAATQPAVNVEAQIQTAHILVYEDTAAEGLWIEPMLKSVGYAENAVFVHDRIGNLKDALTNPDEKWDLIIIAAESHSAVSGELWEYVKAQLDAGTPVIIETWTIHQQVQGKIKPILDACGVELENTMPKAVPVLWYDPDHPFFNSPNQVSELSETNRYWPADAGDFMKLGPGSNAAILAGTSNSLVDSGVITTCYDDRLVLQTFSNHDYPKDQITQLWQNYVYNLLSNHFSK